MILHLYNFVLRSYPWQSMSVLEIRENILVYFRKYNQFH